MQEVIYKLLTKGPVVTDGAWGTELQARGLAVGDFPEAWNLTHPDRVAEVAHAYLSAGSQVILTNTFGANRIRLAESPLAGSVVEINRRGAQISHDAATGKAAVFASIGPSGKLLLEGQITANDLRAAFEEQAFALAEGGVEALVVETMTALDEATLAVTAAKATGLPVVACMVFDSGRDKDHTMMGQTIEEAATTLCAAGADVIGANCGLGIAGFAGICKRLRSATQRPIWIKPNAGLPRIEEGRAFYAGSADEFASHVPEWIQLGANFIGGCCGTGPDHIAAIVRRLKAECPTPL